MEMHRCGNSWVCCDGKCENCFANNMTTSNRTEERRTIAEYIERELIYDDFEKCNGNNPKWTPGRVKTLISRQPAADVAPVRHGRWVLTAHEEYSNYRWNVTAECSECHHSKGEIYAGFFPGFPKELAEGLVLDYAKELKLDNYCPNCGARMNDG